MGRLGMFVSLHESLVARATARALLVGLKGSKDSLYPHLVQKGNEPVWRFNIAPN